MSKSKKKSARKNELPPIRLGLKTDEDHVLLVLREHGWLLVADPVTIQLDAATAQELGEDLLLKVDKIRGDDNKEYVAE